MGIQGLLPLLKSIMNPIHIKQLEGCFVAVDTYSWLHKGALACSTELCKGQRTSKHIDYCMHRVNMLRHYGVKPILVFDGGPLPMKGEQEIKRLRSRKENLSRAMEHESNGNLTAAYECYQKAVDISPSIAYGLIQVLKQEAVPYVVAPYEADAQLTFLALSKHVEAVITEDSDLIAFGCPRIIYKMDKFGQGIEFKNSMLQYNKELNLAGFTQMMVVEMCILSGCDYLPSLPGMGLKKAHSLIKKFRSHKNVIKHLKYNSVEIPPQYEESFKKAILTFRHQRVYDPYSEDIVHLSEPEDTLVEDLDFLGPALPQHIAKGIAEGDLDPFTKAPMQSEEFGDGEPLFQQAYPFKSFKPDIKRKKLELPAQKNLLTNYFCLNSLEAKRNFRVPRITSNHSGKSNETSRPQMHGDEVIPSSNPDFLKFRDAPVPGPCLDGDSNQSKIKLSTAEQGSVCRPCILLQEDLGSDPEILKMGSGYKSKTVRSRYFQKDTNVEHDKKSKYPVDKNDDYRLENVVLRDVHQPLPSLFDDKKEEKTIAVQSSYFQHNISQDADCDRENALGEYPVQTPMFDLVAGECQETAESRKHRVRSSYIEGASLNDNSEDCESEDFVVRDGAAIQPCNYSTLQSLPSEDDSLECIRKRKFSQSDSLTEDVNDNNPISDLEEEIKTEEKKFSCNISHLEQYSEIADKSLEKFASVISSFRYSSSGSRASGLRAPLKDIKNNFLKRPKLNMDLRNFVYTPSKRKTPSASQKTKL
ncbi:exonuclease 1 [Andrographis paniculata]|uniref:exonuclease 1 n=1 Tax=Andrographis paniculata TaxID=175694 RepID=UPI0021E73D57|nr:exonuclease 1 [Andrographis paniculata]XP_051124968.1 exonuclease 1 [Andrographis paniculata]